jgi:hypothetical protein
MIAKRDRLLPWLVSEETHDRRIEVDKGLPLVLFPPNQGRIVGPQRPGDFSARHPEFAPTSSEVRAERLALISQDLGLRRSQSNPNPRTDKWQRNGAAALPPLHCARAVTAAATLSKT